MTPTIDALLMFALLVNFALVGSSRLVFCIRVLAAQGIALGVLPLLLPEHETSLRVAAIAILTVAFKGFLFPGLLLRAQRVATVRHEVEPLVGYSVSLVGAVVALGVAFWLGRRLDLPRPIAVPLTIPAALFTCFIGLFLIVSRKTALNQVIGYLTLENGIYLFGITLAHEEPFLIEMGVLLDVFAAVFVMGIMVFHISREFDHIDVDQLSELKD